MGRRRPGDRADELGRDRWSRPVVDQDHAIVDRLARTISSAANPAATESWRRSPPATTATTFAGNHVAARTPATASLATTTTIRSTSGAAASAPTDQGSSGRSPIGVATLSMPAIRLDATSARSARGRRRARARSASTGSEASLTNHPNRLRRSPSWPSILVHEPHRARQRGRALAVLPGEELRVRVIQEGKELGQGVGFLDDGTMIVVEGGARLSTRTSTSP